jgi:hypothetical protein
MYAGKNDKDSKKKFRKTSVGHFTQELNKIASEIYSYKRDHPSRMLQFFENADSEESGNLKEEY